MTSPLAPPTAGERGARWAFVALGFFIPISVALDNIVIALLVLCWLASGRVREAVEAIRWNPAATLACVWFIAFVLGAFYSIGEPRDVMRSAGRAATFLLIPIAVAVLREQDVRDRALVAFMSAIVLTLLLSYIIWLGAMPATTLVKGVPISPTVFKLHITHNVLVSMGAFLFVLQGRRATKPALRLFWYALAGLAAFNVLYMVGGKSGQLVLLALIVYGSVCWLGRRGVIAGVLLALLVASAAYLAPESALHRRTVLAIEEARAWKPGAAATSSMAHRLEFYRNSFPIVAANPVGGVGTGGFAAAYAEKVRGTPSAPAENPHNEFLMTTVQLGIIGLALMVLFFYVLWKHAARLPSSYETSVARAFVVTFTVAGLASSTFTDHTEGWLFVWATGVLFAGLPRPQNHAAKSR